MPLPHVRGLFDKEYSQKWTGEIFKIKTCFKREGIPIYRLESWDEEKVEGTFYQQEIQSIRVDDSAEYFIQEILKRRVRNKRRWLHWPKNMPAGSRKKTSKIIHSLRKSRDILLNKTNVHSVT